MSTIEVTIGWTRSEVVDGKLVYSSYGDGYKPGASQHQETVTVELSDDVLNLDLVRNLADAAFLATNHPDPEGVRHPLDTTADMAFQIYTQLRDRGFRGQGAHYSLSTGDTVTVGEVTLACQFCGWEQVYPEAPIYSRTATDPRDGFPYPL